MKLFRVRFGLGVLVAIEFTVWAQNEKEAREMVVAHKKFQEVRGGNSQQKIEKSFARMQVLLEGPGVHVDEEFWD